MIALAFMLARAGGQTPTTPAPTEPKVVSTDLKEGDGDPVEQGDIVTVDYTGKLVSGRIFDTSKKPGRKPFVFVVGVREVIKGWDLGLVGMKQGGIRKLVIPPELAYGEKGVPGEEGKPAVIPPSSTLSFTVAVNKIDHAGKRMKIEVTKAGAGAGADFGDDLLLKMDWKDSAGVKVYDSSKYPEGIPIKLGGPPPHPIPGFILGVLGMKAGEKRTITVPPELAFGATGQPSLKIKPNETLTVDIEMISINGVQSISGGRDSRQ